MQIVAHRGLNKSQTKDGESSYQAFVACLRQGWGIEFDVNFTKDGIVIWHDNDLSRLTGGRDRRELVKLTVADFKKNNFQDNRLCDLSELLALIIKHKAGISALHLKGRFQTKQYLDRLILALKKQPQCFKKIIIFDVKPVTARYLKKTLPAIGLAASVAHNFDVKRFKQLTDGTLLTLSQFSKYRRLYDWAWLDEWDLTDKAGGHKKFYTAEIFKTIKDAGLKIALVTPELHSHKPEMHPDAVDSNLSQRLREIIKLKPDLICTDYPGRVNDKNFKVI